MAGRQNSYSACWGSLTALREQGGDELFDARLIQLKVTHKWQWFVRVDPLDNDYIVTDADNKFLRGTTAFFMQEQLVNDKGVSIARDPIKAGGVRPTRVAGWPLEDRCFSLECNIDMEAALESSFMRRMLWSMSGSISVLDHRRADDWDWITPQDSSFKFAVFGLPSTLADHFALVAYSEEPTDVVTAAITQALAHVNTDLLQIACHPRHLHQIGMLTEVICLDQEALTLLITCIPHLGTPAALVASAACCRPIRTLHLTLAPMEALRNTRLGNSRSSGRPDEKDPNPVWPPKVDHIIQPRQILRPSEDPGHEGPHRFLGFKYSLGLPGDIVTIVALMLASFFATLGSDLLEKSVATLHYWQPRIWVKTRSNKPVRVFIAVSWGQLFAGVYQALQGATLVRIDKITRIALSTGICLCIRCLGGLICWKCGRPGHTATACTQNELTPFAKVSYTCIFCGKLGSRESGHEFDICKEARFIAMTHPDASKCGICGHMEHSTVQCPGIYCQVTKSVVLLPKMRAELTHCGWSFGDCVDLAIGTAIPLGEGATAAIPSSSQITRGSQRGSDAMMSQSSTASQSSQSSAQETALTTATATNAQLMAEMRASMSTAIHDQLTLHLLPVHSGIEKINKTLDMHGGNIDALTELVDAQGRTMAKIEAQALSTRDRLQKMIRGSAHQAHPQASADDQVDANGMDEEGLKSPPAGAT
jgi:hypothetical protein